MMRRLIFSHKYQLGFVFTVYFLLQVNQQGRWAWMSSTMSAPWLLCMRTTTTMWSPVSATVPCSTKPWRMPLSPSAINMFQAIRQQSSWQPSAILCSERSDSYPFVVNIFTYDIQTSTSIERESCYGFNVQQFREIANSVGDCCINLRQVSMHTKWNA